jgi:adenylylsulfate kinase-like enzyme
MSMYEEIWQFNRQNLHPYLQVYLDVPMRVLEGRDQKGLYSGVSLGQASDVGGVDLPLALPIDSDLVLENSDLCELSHNVNVILDALGGAPARYVEPEARA